MILFTKSAPRLFQTVFEGQNSPKAHFVSINVIVLMKRSKSAFTITARIIIVTNAMNPTPTHRLPKCFKKEESQWTIMRPENMIPITQIMKIDVCIPIIT
jgi:hypothetical protein